MHALTNSGVILLGVLIFFLFIFVAELLYIFCHRTGSFPDSPSPASKEILLQFFMCCNEKNHSRIEPTGIVSVQMEEEDVTAATMDEEEDVTVANKWRLSRLLYTIEEEDDVVSTEEEDNDGGELRVDIPVECSGEPTPFLTPCDSPPYFTPSPSPCRDIDDVQ